MSARADNQAVAFSEKVFKRLLAAYPKAHREEYGAAMAQLFHDQCRDAWSESRGWGLARLWLRVLPDVIGTSLSEHLDAIKERKFMLNRIATLFRSAQTYRFFTVFTAVFLLVVISVTVITFTLPESFVGATRINVINVHRDTDIPGGSLEFNPGGVDPYFIQTEFELMKSQVVLSKVVEKLDLNQKWGIKFHGGERLKTSESIDLLKRSIDFRPIRNSAIIEIRAYSDQPAEAAELANTIAEAYRNQHLETIHYAQLGIKALKDESEKLKQEHSDSEMLNFQKILNAKTATEEARLKPLMETTAEIVDKARPNLRPVRPNKPMNIIVGIFFGTLLGLLIAGGLAVISFLSRRNAPPKIAS